MGAMPHVLHHPTAGGDGGGSAPLGEERCGRNLWPRFTLFSAPGLTLSNVLIRHPGGEVDAPMAMPFLSGALPLLSDAAAPEQPATLISSGQFTLMLLALPVPGPALACWLWSLVLQRTELNSANALSFLVPLFGLAMGAAFSGESHGVSQPIGIGPTLPGIALTSYRETPTLINADGLAGWPADQL